MVVSTSLFSQDNKVVKLTDGKPAYIPSYLIIEGKLYFKNSLGYTSLGDTLYHYVRKADSTNLYYTPRQIDSVLALQGIRIVNDSTDLQHKYSLLNTRITNDSTSLVNEISNRQTADNNLSVRITNDSTDLQNKYSLLNTRIINDSTNLKTNYINNNEKAVANGVATLDASGKVPISQINDALLGAMSLQGGWDANTNTPSLASATGTKGHYYTVSVAGTTLIDGESDWGLGDWIIFNGSSWFKLDNNHEVTSVNGATGDVVLSFEPPFTKNTAFNKNFGTASGTVAQGNDSRINNGQTAFGWGNHALAGYLSSIPNLDQVLTVGNTSSLGANFGNTVEIKATNAVGLNLNRDLDVNVVGNAGVSMYLGALDGTTFKGGGAFDGVLLSNGGDGYIGLRTRKNNIFIEAVKIDENQDMSLFGDNLIFNENAVLKKIWNGGYGGAVQLLRSDVNTTRYSRIGIVNASGIWQGGITVNNDLSVNFSKNIGLFNGTGESDSRFIYTKQAGHQYLKIEGDGNYESMIQHKNTNGEWYAGMRILAPLDGYHIYSSTLAGDVYSVDAAGNHDFKTGTVTIGGNTDINAASLRLLSTGLDPVFTLNANSSFDRDAYILYQIQNANKWYVGVDDSDGDSYKISPSSFNAPSIKIDNSNNVSIPSGDLNVGGNADIGGSITASNLDINAVSGNLTTTLTSTIDNDNILNIYETAGNGYRVYSTAFGNSLNFATVAAGVPTDIIRLNGTSVDFTVFPTTPASLPTSDYQVANKIYVDENSGNISNGSLTGQLAAWDNSLGEWEPLNTEINLYPSGDNTRLLINTPGNRNSIKLRDNFNTISNVLWLGVDGENINTRGSHILAYHDGSTVFRVDTLGNVTANSFTKSDGTVLGNLKSTTVTLNQTQVSNLGTAQDLLPALGTNKYYDIVKIILEIDVTTQLSLGFQQFNIVQGTGNVIAELTAAFVESSSDAVINVKHSNDAAISLNQPLQAVLSGASNPSGSAVMYFKIAYYERTRSF